MAYDISQTRRFLRQYKKLNDKTAKDVDDAVVQVAKKPTIGKKRRVICANYGYLSSEAAVSFICLGIQ